MTDLEWGAGRVLAEHLVSRNAHGIAVFVCRTYRGTHLGKDRFNAIREATDVALASLCGIENGIVFPSCSGAIVTEAK